MQILRHCPRRLQMHLNVRRRCHTRLHMERKLHQCHSRRTRGQTQLRGLIHQNQITHRIQAPLPLHWSDSDNVQTGHALTRAHTLAHMLQPRGARARERACSQRHAASGKAFADFASVRTFVGGKIPTKAGARFARVRSFVCFMAVGCTDRAAASDRAIRAAPTEVEIGTPNKVGITISSAHAEGEGHAVAGSIAIGCAHAIVTVKRAK